MNEACIAGHIDLFRGYDKRLLYTTTRWYEGQSHGAEGTWTWDKHCTELARGEDAFER